MSLLQALASYWRSFNGPVISGLREGSRVRAQVEPYPPIPQGWTSFATTCFPCTAMTLQRSSTRRSRSCCLMWVTPRWCTVGRAATSTSECPCWTSRHDGSCPSYLLSTAGPKPSLFSLWSG
ncbi:small integral membrane protein 29 isoform X1 [Arvicola amphibius]|uniref:small integral membrane protein 29 isoform X1 n=1 Tax=Arvicola amphibius TaxID=1047088 RepID=UPI001C08F24B|nr:small integral membrane protein 29 isoform X1 [Arvicola amphibius]